MRLVNKQTGAVDLDAIPSGERSNALEQLTRNCLESLGVSLLMDWDVLTFLHYHGMVLSNADEMARLLCSDALQVRGALDRLQSLRLIELSRPCNEARFYKVVASSDVSRQSCFHHLLNLTGNRVGRLRLAGVLKSGTTSKAIPRVKSLDNF